jgi:hypothetical protein
LSLVINETRNRSFFTWRGPQVAPCRSLSACSHHTTIACLRARESSLLVTTWIALAGRFPIAQTRLRKRRALWSVTIEHYLLRSPLHSRMLMVIFFPVPPSTRQAAGPLTENLSHVCLSGRKPVGLSLESLSPRGTMRRLFTRVLPSALAVQRIFAVCIELFEGREARLTTKRGHLA